MRLSPQELCSEFLVLGLSLSLVSVYESFVYATLDLCSSARYPVNTII